MFLHLSPPCAPHPVHSFGGFGLLFNCTHIILLGTRTRCECVEIFTVFSMIGRLQKNTYGRKQWHKISAELAVDSQGLIDGVSVCVHV